MTRRPRRNAGFTLLEAIVALVIFSMGAVALYGWLGVNLTTLQRVDALQQRTQLVRSGMEAVRRVNPMESPSGEVELAGHVYAWSSEAVEPPRNAVTQVGFPTIFQVGLYRMDVQVQRDGEVLESFSVRQLGFRQVASLEEE